VINQLPKKPWAEARKLLSQIAYADLSADRRALAPNASADGISSSRASAKRTPSRPRPFAALRLRTSTAKRYKKARSAEALIWKTLMMAETRFPRLNAPELLKGGHGRKEARRWSRCQEPQPQAGRLISFTHLLT
jgi:hypothetical protein